MLTFGEKNIRSGAFPFNDQAIKSLVSKAQAEPGTARIMIERASSVPESLVAH